MTDDETPAERRLIPISEYCRPSLPTDEWFKALFRRVMARIRPDEKSFIADDRLKRATLRRLEEVVAPPACGPIMAELAASVADWIAQPPTAERIKAIVMPPCQNGDFVSAWAAKEGHQMIAVTDPAEVQAALDTLDQLPDDRETLLVIPSLERWFLRRLDGLSGIRKLLAALARRDQRVVISCNAWAWAYLSKATGIDMIAGAPLCFASFDAERLRDWFKELAQDDTTSGFRFRLSDDGSDLFGDEVTDEESDFFRSLAAKSRGIPWVAWNMWRRMLHTRQIRDADVTGPETDDTLWVAALDELTLPGDKPRETLLILHALLLHGKMTIADLNSVLPIVGDTAIPATLVMSGFLERSDDRLFIRPEAYPAVHVGLESAGMSVGDI